MDHSQEPLLAAYLWGVVMTSPDVSGLSEFYTDAMGYSGAFTDEGWKGWLSGRPLEIRDGVANALDHVLFAVTDSGQLGALRDRLAGAAIAVKNIVRPDMIGEALQFHDPDGNRLVFGVVEPGAETQGAGGPAARLQHLVYASDEVPEMIDFFCRVVGFAPTDTVLDGEDDLTSVFLRCSEEHHSLAVFRAPRKRLDHICYDVEDWLHIRNWADRFAERNITLRWGPGRHGPGNNLFLFVNDPDGNWLEFSAELEQIKEARPVRRWVHEERTLNSWGSALMRS